MIDKVEFRKFVLLCIVLGLVTSGIAQNSTSTTRQKLLQTVRQAKKESSDMSAALISSLIKSIKTGKGAFVSEELVPDYISFLKDENIHVQRLGAIGLNAIKSPKAVEPLFEYVKNKDYADWERRLQDMRSNMNPSYQEGLQHQFECDNFRTVVNTLGELGDSRVVPFLIELYKSTNAESLEIMLPVGRALGKLGAIKELFDMVPGADNKLLLYISDALKAVKDPSKVPELKSAIKDPNEHIMVRDLAVSTIAGIKTTGVSEFIIDIINDRNYPVSVRRAAAVAASQIKDPATEKTLLVYARDPKSPIRYDAFVGLIKCMPGKYVNRLFEIIMDPNEGLYFKQRLIGNVYHLIPQDQLKKCRKQLYDCLNASDQDGRPIDHVRVFAWHQINKVFKEEPSVVLSDRSSGGTIRSTILERVVKENKNLKFQERLKRADEQTQRIVSVYDDKQESEAKD